MLFYALKNFFVQNCPEKYGGQGVDFPKKLWMGKSPRPPPHFRSECDTLPSAEAGKLLQVRPRKSNSREQPLVILLT